MTASDALLLAVRASLLLIVFSLGLRAEPRQANYLVRNSGELGRMVLSMFVVMPALALMMARTFELNQPVRIALVAFALSPVPPVLPSRAAKVSGATDYAIGLLVTASLLSIVIIPLAVALVDRAVGRTWTMSPALISRQMLLGILAPLGAGMVVRRFASAAADRLATPMSTIGFLVLVACLVVILVAGRHELASLFGNGAVLAIAVFVVAGLAAGHWLGGPDPEKRSVLALATSARHPGIAIAIAQTNFPEQKRAAAAVLLCVLVAVAVGAPYKKWMGAKRSTHAIRERHV